MIKILAVKNKTTRKYASPLLKNDCCGTEVDKITLPQHKYKIYQSKPKCVYRTNRPSRAIEEKKMTNPFYTDLRFGYNAAISVVNNRYMRFETVAGSSKQYYFIKKADAKRACLGKAL